MLTWKTLGFYFIQKSVSWRDGLAFLGILHHFCGENKVPGFKDLKPKTNEKENLERAFKIAKELGIEQFMDVSDV